MRRALAVAAASSCLLALPAVAHGGPLRLGFTDRGTFQDNPSERPVALQRVKAARGSLVRLVTGWREIGPTRPPSRAAARDPSWSGYRWGSIDAAVRDTVAAGLTPVIGFTGAPDFAEGPNRPKVSYTAQAGTWRPSPSAYRDFAEAAARRYSGSFGLPAVRYLQAWNEPNLVRYLSPQWVRSGGRLVAAAPSWYRALANGFYQGAKAGNPRVKVIAGSTAPFGDQRPGGYRLSPAGFVRDWLCVTGRAHPRARRCPGGPARFDIFDHHPYSVRGPTSPALNRDDVASVDLLKLTRPLTAAIRGRNVFPRRKKQVWVTEISWDSRPPDPEGVSAGTHARWLEGAFYVLWRRGVDAITWFNLRDQPRGVGYQFTYQSGVFRRGVSISQDVPKPAYQAFRFPFTAYRGGPRARLWGIAPTSGRVTIQVYRHGRWRRLTRVRVGRGRIFSRLRKISRGSLLRALQHGEASVSWRLR